MTEKISRLPISDAIDSMGGRHIGKREDLADFYAGDRVVVGSGKPPEINRVDLYQHKSARNGEDGDTVNIDTTGQTVDAYYEITSGLQEVLTRAGETWSTDAGDYGVGTGYQYIDYDRDLVDSTTAKISRYDKDGELVYEFNSSNPKFARRLAEVAAKRVIRVMGNKEQKEDIAETVESTK